jgi:hypothetical protein
MPMYIHEEEVDLSQLVSYRGMIKFFNMHITKERLISSENGQLVAHVIAS